MLRFFFGRVLYIPLPHLPQRRNRYQSLFLFSEKLSRYNAKHLR